MRLYKITALTNDQTDIRYVGSKAEGVAHRKALAERGFKRKDITEVEVDVPTNKEGLIEFLNGGAV